MRITALTALALASVTLSGCHTPENPAIPVGPAAYTVIPVAAPDVALDRMVRLRAGDVVSLSVAGEPDLKLDDVAISESGTLQVPLAGEVTAAGLTTGELGAAIADKLSAYVRNPRVAVNITQPVVRTVSVEGEVDKPGIFPITRETTLLGALALAQSPNSLAKHDDIFIFRKVDGQQMGARFDLYQLRNGLAPDPQILPDDVVVVGRSRSRAAFEDFLRAAPALNVFALLGSNNNGN
jgi:polysaccharide export outer membrane protein